VYAPRTSNIRKEGGLNDARATHCNSRWWRGGLAAALALERRGAEIVVCEQSPALSDKGAGLHVSPNAVMALRATFPSLSQASAVLY
jgi:hypothetical protein